MIYFITARELGRVKIGYSAEPRSRFVKVQSDSPVELALERVCEGETDDEAALHIRFSSDRLRGEWFVLSDAIEGHMATLPNVVNIVRAPSTLQVIIRELGIAPSYASMVLNGKRRCPINMAIAIYRSTGHRVSRIESLTEVQIDTLESIEPWISPSDRPTQGEAA